MSKVKKMDAVDTYEYHGNVYGAENINKFDKKSKNFRIVYFIHDKVANVSIVPLDFVLAKKICDENNVLVMPDENWTIEYNDKGKWIRFDYILMK